jgi:hypothetical protein
MPVEGDTVEGPRSAGIVSGGCPGDDFTIATEIPDFIRESGSGAAVELENADGLSGLALEAVLLGYDPYNSGRVPITPMPHRPDLRMLEALLKRRGKGIPDDGEKAR